MRTKRACKVKWKVFFIIFKVLSVAKGCLRPENAPSVFIQSFLKKQDRNYNVSIKQCCQVVTLKHSKNWVLISKRETEIAKRTFILNLSVNIRFEIRNPFWICTKFDTVLPGHKRKLCSTWKVWKNMTVKKIDEVAKRSQKLLFPRTPRAISWTGSVGWTKNLILTWLTRVVI